MLRTHHVRVLQLAQLIQDGADEVLGVGAVRSHVAHDHRDVDVVAAVPAVVVRGHADHLVCHLGLTRELGFGERGHIDDAAAPGAVHVGLGAGGELGSLCLHGH